jgi:YgiT-type zinc finger domain-containing protein
MTGKLAKDSYCPLCGGRLEQGIATIPFVFPKLTVIIKGVPAEICSNCHEPFVAGIATDKVTQMLKWARASHAEVSIISYAETPADITAVELAVA